MDNNDKSRAYSMSRRSSFSFRFTFFRMERRPMAAFRTKRKPIGVNNGNFLCIPRMNAIAQEMALGLVIAKAIPSLMVPFSGASRSRAREGGQQGIFGGLGNVGLFWLTFAQQWIGADGVSHMGFVARAGTAP